MAEKRWQITSRSRNRSRLSRDPHATGWIRPDVGQQAEHVVAVFDRDRLSVVLASLHGAGLGHAVRVLDGARGDLRGQLARAGVAGDLGFTSLGPDAVIVLVNATGRAVRVGDILLQLQAREVRVLSRQSDRTEPTAERVPDLTMSVPSEIAGDDAIPVDE